MRKISLDIGTKTCGFAISDQTNNIAISLETIYFEENNLEKIIYALKEYFLKYQINQIIIGLPLRSNGDKSERSKMIIDFAQKIKKIFTQEILFVEEYGSTIKSINILKSANLSIKKRRELKDTVAAKIILQDFLDYGGKKIEQYLE
ncbi:Holliday junction resolvase RuvX [Mycoplasma sp. 1018B]|uniref:Holliday junction resolvase RuvX n=1 Tax=Mycoplasma sp. 1018B TaxID=2967302 RepID=UPI00211CDF1B|nr:Holliday junction resolvase RuvX [Mycoplasma sp. 1018B]UUM19031.1 Holliday junction resolvase RuvX [Mycoplasma sp. 1018B]